MDICLSQLPTIIEEGTAFRVSVSDQGPEHEDIIGVASEKTNATRITAALVTRVVCAVQSESAAGHRLISLAVRLAPDGSHPPGPPLASPAAAARLLIFETRPHSQTLGPGGEHCKTSDLITQERASERKMLCESGGSRVVSLPLMLYLLTWQERVNSGGGSEPLNVMMMGSEGMIEPLMNEYQRVDSIFWLFCECVCVVVGGRGGGRRCM